MESISIQNYHFSIIHKNQSGIVLAIDYIAIVFIKPNDTVQFSVYHFDPNLFKGTIGILILNFLKY